MNTLNHNALLRDVLASLPIAGTEPTLDMEKPVSGGYIPAGEDRFQQDRQVLGSMTLDYKVSTQDTDGRFFLFEQTSSYKGGPPRHIHPDQDEFFYILAGEYLFEAGDQQYRLGSGDFLFVPRGTVHAFTRLGDETGRLLTAFQPAGKMEGYFNELAKWEDFPPREVLEDLFNRYGMQVVGPPLEVE
ncbi:MAG TPA: cupin domain-containing protein [Chthonomonadaceae bacterium]|nr:cupin domain-containing protein [Chthonomonadaceae bacterium]